MTFPMVRGQRTLDNYFIVTSYEEGKLKSKIEIPIPTLESSRLHKRLFKDYLERTGQTDPRYNKKRPPRIVQRAGERAKVVRTDPPPPLVIQRPIKIKKVEIDESSSESSESSQSGEDNDPPNTQLSPPDALIEEAIAFATSNKN